MDLLRCILGPGVIPSKVLKADKEGCIESLA